MLIMSQQNHNNNSVSRNNNHNTSTSKSSKVLNCLIIAVTIVAIVYGLIFGGLTAFKIAQGIATPTNIKLKGNSGKDVKSFELDFSI